MATLGNPGRGREKPLPTVRASAFSRPRPSSGSRDSRRSHTPYVGESIRCCRGRDERRFVVTCARPWPEERRGGPGARSAGGRALPRARSVTDCVPQRRASCGLLWCGRGPGHRGAARLQAAWPAAAARFGPPTAGPSNARLPLPGRRVPGSRRLLPMGLWAVRPGATAYGRAGCRLLGSREGTGLLPPV